MPAVIMVRPGPQFSVMDVHRGWSRGLTECGIDVVEFTLDDRLELYTRAQIADEHGELSNLWNLDESVKNTYKHLEALIYEVWPMAVVFTSGFYMDRFTIELLKKRPPVSVLLCTEAPYEDPRQLVQAPEFDLAVLNDPVTIDDYRAVCRDVFYAPHAYDPTVHTPGPATADLKCDVGFCGTGYPSRIEFLERVDWSGLDVLLAGNWESLPEGHPLERFLLDDRAMCWDNDDTVELYRSSRSSLNLYRREGMDEARVDGWAMGPREVELAAAGAFYMTEPRGENREVLPMVPTFEGPAEYNDRIRWYLDHDAERDRIVHDARDAIAGRTFSANAKLLLEHIERLT